MKRNYLLLHGIPENTNEKTYYLCLTTMNEHLELSITETDIECRHGIGKPRDSGQNSRPITVKFVSYDRKNVFNRKRKQRGNNIAITESLTTIRMKKLK